MICAVYNASPYLGDLCESLSSQTYKGEKQIIFVNDGSTDDSAEIIEATPIEGFSKVLLTQDNAGLSSARNHALAWIAEMRPDFDGYVMFLDSDDTLPAGSIETACHEMTANDLDKLFFTGNVFYESDDLKENLRTILHITEGMAYTRVCIRVRSIWRRPSVKTISILTLQCR